MLTKLALVLSLVFLLAAMAYGQAATVVDGEPSSPSKNQLSSFSLEQLLQVKVTSVSLFERNALTVGATVSVIEPSDWQREGARTTLEAIAHQPGTMLLPSLYGLNVVAIRGYAQVGSSRGIGTLLDGIPMNGPTFGSGQYVTQNIGLGVLDRIEVIRGPGSALYGSDAFHGVIAMSAFESEKDLTRVSAEGGSDHYYQAALQHSAGFGNDARVNLAVAASGEQFDRSYQARDLSSGLTAEVNPDESTQSQTATLKMLFKPSPSLKVRAGFYWDDHNTDNSPGAFSIATDSDWNSTTKAGQLIATQELGAGGTLEWRVYHVNNRADRSVTRTLGGLGIVDDHSISEQTRTGTELIYRQPEIESINTQFAVGMGYQRAKFVEGQQVRTLLPLDDATPPVESEFPGEGSDRDISHLLLDARTVLPDERWSLSYGGRLDDYSDFGSQFSPRVGLIFQPYEDAAIKLLYSQAFRAPTFLELHSGSGRRDIDPETLDSYELVFIKQSERWSAEIVLFENHWEDGIKVFLDAGEPGGFTYKNTGENESQGVETTFAWQTDGAWRFDLNGSYVKSSNSVTNTDYEMFPRVMATLGVGRKFDSLGADIYFTNHFFDQAKDTSSPTADDLPLYWRADLTFNKAYTNKLDLHLKVLNLFDRDNQLPSVLGHPEGVEGRSFSVSVGFRYRI
jgi:outer membrane cobalamin receptor